MAGKNSEKNPNFKIDADGAVSFGGGVDAGIGHFEGALHSPATRLPSI